MDKAQVLKKEWDNWMKLYYKTMKELEVIDVQGVKIARSKLSFFYFLILILILILIYFHFSIFRTEG